MKTTCREAIEEVFRENSGPLSPRMVILEIYRRYPNRPWKEMTIRLHLSGLSVNHPSGKHHPALQNHAFLYYLEDGQYRLVEGSKEIYSKTDPSQNIHEPDNVVFVEEKIDDEEEKLAETSKVNENQWMTIVLNHINDALPQKDQRKLIASQGKKLSYAFEILSYQDQVPAQRNITAYETDILIYEVIGEKEWKPRIVIEGKLGSVTTHDAITYSQKALTHKNVHPYLRYGIILGNRRHYPLPGRLFRHGAYFDFMLSWKALEPTDEEMNRLLALILDEVEASRNLDEILFNSRNPNRARYTLLHRPLKLA